MLFIDANIFLALDNLRDVQHNKATELWKEIETGKYENYFTTDYVFNEVMGVTYRKFGKERAVLLGESILRSIFIFHVDEHLLAAAWKIFSATKLGLNMTDCTHIAVMEATSVVAIATFDKEFTKVKEIQVIS